MAHTLKRYIEGISKADYKYFWDQVHQQADYAKVGIYIHEFPQEKTMNVQVDVWSDNPGSVDDYTQSLLDRIAANPTHHGIFEAVDFYTTRLRNYYAAEENRRTEQETQKIYERLLQKPLVQAAHGFIIEYRGEPYGKADLWTTIRAAVEKKLDSIIAIQVTPRGHYQKIGKIYLW